jgi:subtilase family serine protease
MNLSVLCNLRITGAACLLLFALFAGSVPLRAQNTIGKRPLITERVDEQKLITLAGNTRPEVKWAKDLGPVAEDLPLEHMYLQLKRAPEQQRALEELVARLHDQKAPEYHHWLTADQIAARFGPAEEDIQSVTAWLESHGFRVNVVYRPNGVIDFSGPAGAIHEAFHTEIHNLEVNSKAHIANVSDPKIPAALVPVVHGVVSMNDFRPKTGFRPQPQYTFSSNGSTVYAVVPGDLATIYNLNPLYAARISGQGQTIVLLEDSDVYSVADWYTYRQTFGLLQGFPQGTFQQVHPQPSNNPDSGGPCTDPGVNSDDGEATGDVEIASAAAPNAAIVLASCSDTNTNFGAFIAMQNMLTGHGRPPGIFSLSYSESETQNGASGNAYVNGLYEIAVLQGVSVFVSAGDDGGAGSDYFTLGAMHGINVNGFASTPHNVAVGGTDFADTYFGENSAYWNTTNGKHFNSALSYVPEMAWNESCASPLISTYYGFGNLDGANSLCNSSVVPEYLLVDLAGGGGPSGCAFGSPNISSVVGGTCRGYPKPFYQWLVAGIPNDGVRDLPDVSLFAAILGIWSHYYIGCFSDPNNGGTPCVGAPSNWTHGGGTSAASPIMAGIQAMVNQAAGRYQGNPNYVLYALAASEYDFSGAGGCNATLGNQINPRCIFHDVTLGNTNVDCLPLVLNGVTVGTFDCYIPSGTYGVLSLSNSLYEPAYPATPGWDFATGLGSVNAYNLVKNWPGSNLQ